MNIQTMKIEIDKLINKICRNVVGGELTQLGALFNSCFLDGLSQIIYSGECAKHPSLLISVDAELCWIDKAPYAKLCSGIPFDNKVELGDAMFIFEEKLIVAGSLIVLNERKKAFILQAKITDKEAQICNVPIANYDKRNNKDSTFKEFELYRKWSSFDIYYASNTKKIQEYNVNLINGSSTDPCRFAWYGVAASTRIPNLSSSWPCRWMIGKAVMNTPCNKTLGELLSGFYQNHIIDGSQVGEYFEGASNSNPAWEKVVHHVLVRSKQLGKPSYFPTNATTQNRIVSSHKRFIAPQLIQLFSSFGLNGRIITCKLLNYLLSNSHYPLHYVVSRSLKKSIPPRLLRLLFDDVLDILQPFYPVTLRLNGIHKPRKFPLIRVTVQRQAVENFNIDDKS
ncbi:hypothetical protein [Kosakonia sp. R1.Fl]|uniref:hypothetical protein n=1 Tax=Kosakonia sp. R1.Fl TaxID=2928706 RepID=UPI00201E6F23|nr:hypothetical protein [Kosakonia sp. R1.Fl]MCL6746868.1 hypothetical protein [Kosakonia sp. R1.Fl]MCL6747038.1 hypothetical protein [Kosakonia sp. R1.Fl]